MTAVLQAQETHLGASVEWIRSRLEACCTGPVKPLLGKDRAGYSPSSRPELPPAISYFRELWGLSEFEANVLLLCAAMEVDTGIGALCAAAQQDSGKPYPTFALAMTAFAQPAWDALSPDRPLRYWKMVEIHQYPGQPVISCPLRADERIVNYIKGLNCFDERLASSMTHVAPGAAHALSASQVAVARRVAEEWKGEEGSGRRLVQLLGSDEVSKKLIAASAAQSLGRWLYVLPAEFLPAQLPEVELLARLWRRESMLLPLALYVDAHDIDLQGGGSARSLLGRFLSRVNALVCLGTRELWPGMEDTIGLDAVKPSFSEQKEAWSVSLGDDASAAVLAAQYNLNLSRIDEVVRHAASNRLDHISESCRESVRPRLDALAQRIDVKATWDDLVLPPEPLDLLHEIAGQALHRTQVYEEWGFGRKMNRGRGVSAVFAGASGTGKTMAAEVIASELQLNLYRIDLSAVVSKYIGQTEKNLRMLFDAAEEGGVILFFDEADALFGKRSEVKDSHDRYANIEVNYLLQRMESFSGLAILATNMKSALDTAFLRRLRFVVNFAFPGFAERRLIWQKSFPAETPVEGIDFDRLARLNLTGGTIHTASVNAAFRAARAGSAVTMPVVLAAVRAELLKLDRPADEADFRWNEPEPPATQ
jgi:ATP-dependent 26S proteasome regulatory subunit